MARQPRVQPPSQTTKAPQEFGKPRTGFDDEGAKPGPDAGLRLGQAGPGIGSTRRGIH